MDIRDFTWPEQHEMSDTDRALWNRLIQALSAYMQSNWGKLNSQLILDMRDVNYTGRLKSYYLYPKKRNLPAYGFGSAWAEFIGFPEFMQPVINAYIDALNRFFPTTNGSGDIADLPEWVPPLALMETITSLEWWDKFAQQLPHVSVSDCSKLAFWQTPQKMTAGIETQIKPGAYVKRHLNPNARNDVLEAVTQSHIRRTGSLSNSVYFVENDDVQGWLTVYSSKHITSCMTGNNEIRCYAAASFGLADNGLRLAWLAGSLDYSQDKAVARCIVHEPSRSFYRHYGDNTIVSVLESLGYEYSDQYPEGLILGTWEHRNGEFATPYVDGDIHRAHLNWIDDKPAWELDEWGDYDLQTTCGYIDTQAESCPVCGDRERLDHEAMVDGEYTCVCETCYYDMDLAFDQGMEIRCSRTSTTDIIHSSYGYTEIICVVDNDENTDYYCIHWCDLNQEYIGGDNIIELADAYGYCFEHNDLVVPLDASSETEKFAYIGATVLWDGRRLRELDMIDWEHNGVCHQIPAEGLNPCLDAEITTFKEDIIKASNSEPEAA